MDHEIEHNDKEQAFLDNLLDAFDESTAQSEADLKAALREAGFDPDRVTAEGLQLVAKTLRRNRGGECP